MVSTPGPVAELEKALNRPQVRQQVVRFGRLFVIAVGAQLAALGGAHLGRSATVGVLVGALEVTFRQFVPVVSWPVVSAGLEAAAAKAPPVPPPVPPVPPSVG